MKYPLGIQTFSDLIENEYVYVDKTALIYKLIDQGKWYFLSRPRRFGKSLLVSTLEALFRGRKELFDGLDISNTSCSFDAHPVIKLEFTKADIINGQSFQAFISEQATALAHQHSIPLNSNSFERQFDQLVSGLHQSTGQKVVLLIDEYDKPILNTMETPELVEVKRVMNAFYAMVKALDENLQFVFVTGVSKFSKVSVFSGMNNLRDISANPTYSTLCGYSQEEIEKYFSGPISNLAKKHNKNVDQTKQDIAQWYNGYRFSGEGEGVYNPHSILSLLDNGRFQNYWFQTATPTFLINRLKEKQYSLSQLDNLRLSPEGLDPSEPENTSIQALLLQTGYLTIKTWDDTLCELDFPNKEVRRSFYSSVVEQYAYVEKGLGPVYLDELRKALIDKNLQLAFTKLSLFFANIPYDISIQQEKYYQSIFFSVFKMLGFHVETEVTTNKGRIDCVIQTDNYTYVIEFKLNGTKEEALKQIKDKKYAQKYQGTKKTIVLIGVEFDRDERNIGEWVEECL